MDSGKLNLFIKQIREDYKLSSEELQILAYRLMADDKEFDRVLRLYKSRSVRSGVDSFKPFLTDLVT